MFFCNPRSVLRTSILGKWPRDAMRTRPKTHCQWYLQGIVRSIIPIFCSSLFQFRDQHVCHFMHMNHDERSSKNINPCTRKSAQRTNICQFMCMNHKERSSKSINSYATKSAQRNQHMCNMYIGSWKMNHQERIFYYQEHSRTVSNTHLPPTSPAPNHPETPTSNMRCVSIRERQLIKNVLSRTLSQPPFHPSFSPPPQEDQVRHLYVTRNRRKFRSQISDNMDRWKAE